MTPHPSLFLCLITLPRQAPIKPHHVTSQSQRSTPSTNFKVLLWVRHPCPPHLSLLIPSGDQTYYEQGMMAGTEKTEGHCRSLLGRRIADNRNASLTWLLFHTVLQKWLKSPWGHISPPPRPFHDPIPVTHSKVFWDIDSCFLGNCHSDQGQSTRLLPALSPGITIFGSRKVDCWQFPSFIEVFTHVLFLLLGIKGRQRSSPNLFFCHLQSNSLILKLHKQVQRYSQSQDSAVPISYPLAPTQRWTVKSGKGGSLAWRLNDNWREEMRCWKRDVSRDFAVSLLTPRHCNWSPKLGNVVGPARSLHVIYYLIWCGESNLVREWEGAVVSQSINIY